MQRGRHSSEQSGVGYDCTGFSVKPDRRLTIIHKMIPDAGPGIALPFTHSTVSAERGFSVTVAGIALVKNRVLIKSPKGK